MDRTHPTRLHARTVALLAVALTAFAAPSLADPHTAKLDATPDMSQLDLRLPDAGEYYCGPVALSNGLMWLARNGYPKLIPRGNGDEQVNMTILLAGNSYLKTYQNKGTSTPRLMTGVLKFFNRQGYDGQVRYRGWRTIDRQFQRRVGLDESDYAVVPDLDWLRQGLQKDTAVVLDIGWYRHDAEGDTYKRLGGHWVTLVGHGESADGQRDDGVLIIHNPDPRAGAEPSHDRVRCEAIESGVLGGPFQGLPVAAKGFLRVTGVPMPPGVDAAVVDGGVIVRIAGERR
jgi:hypothetical protein